MEGRVLAITPSYSAGGSVCQSDLAEIIVSFSKRKRIKVPTRRKFHKQTGKKPFRGESCLRSPHHITSLKLLIFQRSMLINLLVSEPWQKSIYQNVQHYNVYNPLLLSSNFLIHHSVVHKRYSTHFLRTDTKFKKLGGFVFTPSWTHPHIKPWWVCWYSPINIPNHSIFSI